MSLIELLPVFLNIGKYICVYASVYVLTTYFRRQS